MHTTDLIELIKTKPVTATEVYNLLMDGLFEGIPNNELLSEASIKMISNFRYQIVNVLVPVIDELKAEKP